MKRSVLLILVDKRKESAVNMQKTLTAWGCLIKTRLGLHDGVMDNCSQSGLIMCELAGTEENRQELTRKLNLLKGVKAELVEMSLDPIE
ncbi:MAG: hypothetical protein PHQ27_09060 [Victivallales bacterium]|nr:hypothetical protein [Victivallales bacterium]